MKNRLFCSNAVKFYSVAIIYLTFAAPSYAEKFNNPRGEIPPSAESPTSFTVVGTQSIADTGDCSFVTVTVSGDIRGVVDDGGGMDQVTFELWDDSTLKDSRIVEVPVGTVLPVSVTMRFAGLYGLGAPGVGVVVSDPGGSIYYVNDPFTPDDVQGSCEEDRTLTVTTYGSGTVTSSPAGIDCGTICSANYPLNTLVSLTATPVGGYSFAGWSGDADCTDGKVTMSAHVNCTATFSQPVVVEKSQISVRGGYIKLDTTGGSEPDMYDCSGPGHYGRQSFDEINNILFICTPSGWSRR